MFTRAENFKIIGWIIQILVGFVPIWFLQKETKKIERRLEKEIIARKNSEKKIVENELKKWESLYRQEKEGREKDRKTLEEVINNSRERNNEINEEKNRLEKEVWDVRKQLFRKGVPWEKHNISDESQRREAVWDVEAHWEKNQNKSGKINKKTITDVLGENWQKNFKNKEGEDIIKERDCLIEKINYEINQQNK